jgi:putative ABC transport system permease protein
MRGKTVKTIRETLASAWVGVVTHKLRSFLTILGIVIGVAAVIALMSIGRGAQADILARVESMGANRLSISGGAQVGAGGVRGASGSSASLTMEDARAIETSIKGIQYVVPNLNNQSQLVVPGANTNSQVIGTGVHYKEAYNLTVASGSFLTQSDYDNGEQVVVLGSEVSNTLFPTSDPIGQTMRIGGKIFRVVGVLVSKGSGMGSADSAVIIPLPVTQKLFTQPRTVQGDKVVSSIDVVLVNKDDSDTVKADITTLMRERHRLATSASNDFTIRSMEEMADTMTAMAGTMTALLTAIASISLLVGGIGVMNIMLVSVLERTREIGIRKALGAGERDIWSQFLYEAAFLCLAGGIIGVGIGWTVAFVLKTMGLASTQVTADSIVLAVSVSLAIGVFFGFYPAWNASRLNPIQALRSD